jgi:hypothetical protein
MIIYVILAIVIYYIIFYKKVFHSDNLVLEKSTLDGESYLVQNKSDKLQTANKLAFIKANIKSIINYLKNNKDNYPLKKNSIEKFLSRTKIINIKERPEHETDYTSYTINKGDMLVFCLRSSYLQNIHDNNTIMYVVIHELAHVFSDGYGHGEEFVENFKFLLQISKKINIYEPINYLKTPQEYCGMTIQEYLF